MKLHEPNWAHSFGAIHSRMPDVEMEMHLLRCMNNVTGASVEEIAGVAAQLALEACRAGSAGVSLLAPSEPEGDFHWTALAGLATELTGGQSPRYDSACGQAVDCNQVLLFKNPERQFTWMQKLNVMACELLVAPILMESGSPLGTIWAVHHVEIDCFCSADLRYITLLANSLAETLSAI